MHRIVFAAFIVLVIALGAATATATGGSSRHPVETFVGPIPPVIDEGQIVHEVGTYLVTVAYDDAVAQSAATDTFLRSLYVAPVVIQAPKYYSSAPAASGEVGECTGFSIPSYIIQRESGGSSTAMNPSGAYGCAQTLLSHYNGGSCSGLDPYTLDGQRACVNILSDGGTNLAPWAETR